MSEPVVIRWPLPGRTLVAGELIACPTCDAVERLTLAMDLDDRSKTPSYMACPQGHLWPEPRFTRRLAAELLDDMLDLDPSLLAHLEALADDCHQQGEPQC